MNQNVTVVSWDEFMTFAGQSASSHAKKIMDRDLENRSASAERKILQGQGLVLALHAELLSSHPTQHTDSVLALATAKAVRVKARACLKDEVTSELQAMHSFITNRNPKGVWMKIVFEEIEIRLGYRPDPRHKSSRESRAKQNRPKWPWS